jgi:hypothetical protein
VILIWQKFQRHEAVQPNVLGLIHHAHAAAAQFAKDAVMRDGWPITSAES